MLSFMSKRNAKHGGSKKFAHPVRQSDKNRAVLPSLMGFNPPQKDVLGRSNYQTSNKTEQELGALSNSILGIPSPRQSLVILNSIQEDKTLDYDGPEVVEEGSTRPQEGQTPAQIDYQRCRPQTQQNPKKGNKKKRMSRMKI